MTGAGTYFYGATVSISATLLDGYKWENDWKADKYIPAPYSNADNSVVVTKLPSKK